MGLIHHRVDAQAGLVGGVFDLGRLAVVHRADFHQVEPDVYGQLEAVEIRHLGGQHADEDRFLDAPGGCRRHARESSGGSRCHQKTSSVHGATPTRDSFGLDDISRYASGDVTVRWRPGSRTIPERS